MRKLYGMKRLAKKIGCDLSWQSRTYVVATKIGSDVFWVRPVLATKIGCDLFWEQEFPEGGLPPLCELKPAV